MQKTLTVFNYNVDLKQMVKNFWLKYVHFIPYILNSFMIGCMLE